MGRLHALYTDEGQSPWLDNLKRAWLQSGEIQQWIDRGVRGITSNPSIFQKAIESATEYDEQFSGLIAEGVSVDDAYWKLVVSDIEAALALLRPVYDESDGVDGYVSVEVSPALAHDGPGTEAAARHLDDLIDEPNLLVKIPATAAGVPAIRAMIAEQRSINVTLIFSLERYADVMEAYISGLEAAVAGGATDLSKVASVASFFISRVDVEVDKRLEAIGTPEALALRGRAAFVQGQLAYEMFTKTFAGPRWEALAAKGARVQRPLWASTSTKNPAYPDTLYLDTLIGPDTVNTVPDATLVAFEDHGTVARTVDADLPGAHALWEAVGKIVDLDDVAEVLETEGVASFIKSFDDLLDVLGKKAADLA
ncbi:MAG: transaldolase [Acidimicrobiales bacterium]